MIFYNHSDYEDRHAFLGASQYYWLNYDDNKIIETYKTFKAKERGTILHAFAKTCIDLGQKLPKSNKTLNLYVNDAIGFKMRTEQPLVYSDNAFGTADAICFRNDILRIHDLKSGVTPASMNQLKIYAAYFCLEYEIDPKDIVTILRIYQNNAFTECTPDPLEIQNIMDKTIKFDKIISELQEKEEM